MRWSRWARRSKSPTAESKAASAKASLQTGTILANVIKTPLSGKVQQLAAPEGSTLAVMIEAAFADPIARRFVVVKVDGVEVAPALWADMRPRAGQLVEVVSKRTNADIMRARNEGFATGRAVSERVDEGAGRERADLERRVGEQQAHELAPGVPGGADDRGDERSGGHRSTIHICGYCQPRGSSGHAGASPTVSKIGRSAAANLM